MKALLDERANVNIKDACNNSLLHLVGYLPTVALLLKNGADPTVSNKEGLRPIHMAMENPCLIPLLLIYGADLSVTTPCGRTALSLAASEDHIIMIKMIKTKGIDKKKCT